MSTIAVMGAYEGGQRMGGRYVVVRLIAVGGFGEIFEAAHEFSGSQHAIKVQREELRGDGWATERMRREAVLGSHLRHPGLVEVTDSWIDDGRVFLVMPLLNGRTLRQVINDDGAIPHPKALRYGAQIASAVAALHHVNVLHRDLAPSNVFICIGDTVKVLDLGLARVGDRSSARSGILGTIAYMSPEQVRGETLDERSDVFALGQMLYEAVLGRHAHSNPAGQMPRTEVLSALIQRGVTPLPRLIDGLPRTVWDALAPALAIRRSERYPSMAEFGVALQAALDALQELESWVATACAPQHDTDVDSVPAFLRAGRKVVEPVVITPTRASGRPMVIRVAAVAASIAAASALAVRAPSNESSALATDLTTEIQAATDPGVCEAISLAAEVCEGSSVARQLPTPAAVAPVRVPARALKRRPSGVPAFYRNF